MTTTTPLPLPPVEEFLTDLLALVSVESPTEAPTACDAALDVLDGMVRARVGRAPRRLTAGGRTHLHLPATGPTKVLLLGHIDTVWPLGTLARWPMTTDGDVVSGPGVFDMKAGLVMGLHAMQAIGADEGVGLLVTSDEETGSATSKTVIEDLAQDAEAVLVLEPAGPGGAIKMARKGVGMFTAHLTGRAAHAGLDPEKGINALLALADVVPQVAAISDPAVGTTVTPTVAAAGTTRNTVPATAHFLIDVRTRTIAEMDRVRTELADLRPTVANATVRIVEDGWRPPLEEVMSAGLVARYLTCRRRLRLPEVAPMAVGGGSDGNFTAALGIPTLDGLGAVGDGAHAEGEHLLLPETLDATRVLSALLSVLTKAEAA